MEKFYNQFQSYPLSLHPNTSLFNTKTKNLAQKYGLRYPSDLSNLTGYVYPYLSPSALQVSNNWHAFLWFLDDKIDDPDCPKVEKEIILNHIIEYLSNKCKASHPITQFLDDEEMWLQYKESKCRFECERQAILMIQKGMIPKWDKEDYTVHEYEKIRFYDSGCETVWPLMFLDDGILPQYGVYTKFGNTIVCRVNDLYSYAKDVYRDKSNYNYFVYYMQENNCHLDEVINIVTEEVKNKWHMLKNANNNTAERVNYWCLGNLVWHHASERYKVDLSKL
ncbi:Terpenoid synthase [Orpheovirus IHUMI-LCC2]|uniref:Terpenoid synthase n=2 Tax=Orpheovirus IHUMI-LCC2 TaxID=2023057 RepID=A0A2I2L5I9_9VIRU|nr:Terpenoid synthase [Orpheovirus IHUMI-LCC2]SNW62786.1 Terpenoid synthase [Orpheovirus IHUMI-LCC2]